MKKIHCYFKKISIYPGSLTKPHPIPYDVIPATTYLNFPFTKSPTNNGVPESPWQVSFPPANSPAHTSPLQSVMSANATSLQAELS